MALHIDTLLPNLGGYYLPRRVWLPKANMEPEKMNIAMDPETKIQGILHVSIAFDWGDEIDLQQAWQLVPSEWQSLPRRRRTPPSIAYRPPPLLIRLAPVALTMPELGNCIAESDATVFDFGAMSVALRIPFSCSARQLLQLANSLAEPESLLREARLAAEPVYQQLLPAIENPDWSDVYEEYFTFQLFPGPHLPAPPELLEGHGTWLAGLLRLEDTPLSREEVQESLKQRISYSPSDLVVVEWSAAVMIDVDCEETLQTIEFANLQLLEFRCIDGRVDEALDQAYRLVHPLTMTWLPFWRMHTRPLRVLGDMRIVVVILLERTSSTLKLVGDQYLARVYRMLTARFRLDEWSQGIRQSLDETQRVYQTLSEQSSAVRIEILEIIIIVLIVFEIAMVFWE